MCLPLNLSLFGLCAVDPSNTPVDPSQNTATAQLWFITLHMGPLDVGLAVSTKYTLTMLVLREKSIKPNLC